MTKDELIAKQQLKIESLKEAKEQFDSDQKNTRVVFLIRYGTYLKSGYIKKFAASEESIIKIVKEDDLIVQGNGVIDVKVDFDEGVINYTYRDWDDEIEVGQLYFDKIEVI